MTFYIEEKLRQQRMYPAPGVSETDGRTRSRVCFAENGVPAAGRVEVGRIHPYPGVFCLEKMYPHPGVFR